MSSRKLWLCLCLSLCLPGVTAACDSQTDARNADGEAIVNFFQQSGKRVLTFVGFSGAGYEDESRPLAIALDILGGFDPSMTIVNIGATPEGIGALYELAKRRGFVTTGIVSSQAKRYQVALSECVDFVFYVEDDSWGGLQKDSGELSPTSAAMVGISDSMIGIGGGEIARDELRAALPRG